MLTRFQFLQEPAGLLQARRGDGWQLQGEPSGPVTGTHPDVADEVAARYRLDRLGLLISRPLRIHFEHSQG
jgi:hypothetical protein